MATSPLVSIVMPVFNDEEWLASALDSCLRQTESRIEIICVDDASTDSSRSVVERYGASDDRVRLIAQPDNRSAFQARRAGIFAARSDYVLFLDGDDELAPEAVARTLAKANQSGADMVGFGVKVLTDDGRKMGRFERVLQPQHSELRGASVLAGLFPVGQPAQGHLWRYLFRTSLLKGAYQHFAHDLKIYRANDLPITFLAAVAAEKYVSIPEKLYRYRFGRGTSGKRITTIDDIRFYLSGIESVERVASALPERSADIRQKTVVESYSSARLSVIANFLKYAIKNADASALTLSFEELRKNVSELDIVQAAASFLPDALPVLTTHLDFDFSSARTPSHVLLATGNLRIGGVQAVLISQAESLVRAGYKVSIAVHDIREVEYRIPAGVELLAVHGKHLPDKVASWVQLLNEHPVDLVIDHHLMYNERWPFLVLAARALGVPTIGWLHSFALRPLADSRDRTSFLVRYLPLLREVVVLSPIDVTFWKLRGVERVVYLPNPPSDFLRSVSPRNVPRRLEGSPIELVWWGRLQQSTKQVGELIRLAAALRDMAVEFRLTIIGPDGDDLTAEDLRRQARKRGIDDALVLRGSLYGQELVSALERAHVFVSTSVVEGYQLTILEAQTVGIPVAMYELPWLVTVAGNEGVVSVPQGDVHQLAARIAEIAADPEAYSALSAASLRFAQVMRDIDIEQLYKNLVNGSLEPSYSPPPSVEQARLLLEWTFFYAERNARARARLARSLRASEHDLALQKRLYAQVASGMSFRVGRFLTYFPRKLRRR